MKKTVSLLVIAFIAFSCTSEFSSLSDLETANIKGNVWKIRKTVHDANARCACPAAMKNECNENEYVYNEKGNLLVSYSVDADGSVADSSTYVYNMRGECSEIIRFKGRKPAGKDIAVYKGGRLTGYKKYDENGVIQATITFRYSGDKISEEKTLDSRGEIVSSVEKEYSNGQLVSQTEKDNKGNTQFVRKFKRNAGNDIIESLVMVTEDNTEYKFSYEYEYDSAGNWTKQIRSYDNQIENVVMRNIEYFAV